MTIHTTYIDISFHLSHPFAIGYDQIGGLVRTGNAKALASIGLDGQLQMQREIGSDIRATVGVENSEMWLAFNDRLEQRTLSGELISELTFQFDAIERRIGSAILSNGELFVAVERLKSQGKHGLSGELYRMRKDGEVLWGSTLGVDRIEFAGCVEATAKNGYRILPKPAWKPKSWVTIRHAPVVVSSEYVLASWQEHPSSGIGKHYAVRLTDGHPVAITKPLPVSWTCNLGDGCILISASGYGVCQTVRLDAKSSATGLPDLSWKTHGRFFKSNCGELYCVEMIHGSTRSAHVVRLLPDGSTEPVGGALAGYHTSQPLPLNNERFCFWRNDQVWICDTNAGTLESVTQTKLGENAYAESVILSSNRIAILVYRNATAATSSASQLVIVEDMVA